MTELKLHRKLAEVMGEVERIPKNGTAPAQMGGFKFVQVGDAADAIRKALAARRVSMLPTSIEVVGETEHATAKGGTMTTQTVRTTWTITDGETGETAQIQSIGTGADTGDKFSPKAQTNSMKYALLMGFLLSTGEDPELSDSSDRRARHERIADRAVANAGFLPPAEPGSLIGVPEVGKSQDSDFELRQTPSGHRIGFRLVQGRKGIKTEAFGALAEQIAEYRQGIEGQTVTCFGSVRDETFRPKGAERDVTYQVLTLSRLKVGALDLTEPETLDDAAREAFGDMADDEFDKGWLDRVPA